MADDRGTTAPGHARPDWDLDMTTDKTPEFVTLSFSLTKKVAGKIGRIKRWEERSKSKSLELTGRR